eukprot:6190624-Pleurochrysis_carterae.AAC.1
MPPMMETRSQNRTVYSDAIAGARATAGQDATDGHDAGNNNESLRKRAYYVALLESVQLPHLTSHCSCRV